MEEANNTEVEMGDLLVSPIRRSASIAKLVEALAGASMEFGEVAKDTKNPFYKSTYADLAALIKATRSPLGKHGLIVTQFPLISNSRARAGVSSLLAHSSGEWMEAELTLPVTKQDAQGVASVGQYAAEFAKTDLPLIALGTGGPDGAEQLSGSSLVAWLGEVGQGIVMKQVTYRCDVCGSPKGETNHWWIVVIHGSHGREISIGLWTDTDARQDGVLHLCGQQCVELKVSEFLGGQQ